MNFILAIIESLVGFVQRNPLTTLLIVILALGAPALLKGIALFILYFLMGLVILVVVLMLAFRWRIYKVRKQMEQQFGEGFGQQSGPKGFGGFGSPFAEQPRMVGATTRAGQITGPLRDRFGVLLKLELYGPDELARIIMRSAGILDQPITPEGAYELAKCSRGTPRVANRFLKRIRDFATVLGDGVIDRDVALMGLKRMDVDALGLDELDRSVLRAIIEMYNGGPVGLETLAAALGEEAVTLEDLCEPYLMQMGFLTRTPRGRCVTRLAYEHLGMKAPESGAPEDNGQQSLF